MGITDADQNIVEVNQTLCRLTGLQASDLLGKTVRVFVSDLQDDAFYADMQTCLNSTGQWEGEFWNNRPDGSLYAVRLHVTAVYDRKHRLTHYVALMADITQAKLHEMALAKNASFDGLTGLPNRLLLADRMHQALAQAKRSRTLLAVCYLDLDGFKRINDEQGHEAGDTVLVETGHRIAAIIREGDTLARVGGDEFVLLLPGLAADNESHHTLDRILHAVAQPITVNGTTVSISASVGIATGPRDGNDLMGLLAKADSAMYKSKQAGGNRYTMYQPEAG